MSRLGSDPGSRTKEGGLEGVPPPSAALPPLAPTPVVQVGPPTPAGSDKCLDDETLGAFLENRLDFAAMARIDAHAAMCSACRELIALGAKVAESVATPGVEAEEKRRVGASVLLNGNPTSRRVGTMLKDKWRLDAVIGIGGMAEVYSGTHRNGKRVAVKILLPQLAVDPELCRRFVQEGYIANHIGHPNVVTVHDDDKTADGAPFIVMDLLEGESIADVIAPGRMPVGESVRVAIELLAGLSAAHEKGILHRDVKPGNVFRTKTGEVKLLDFGIARVVDSTNATVTGATMGTPAYMPQEQARGLNREVDARTDVWAAGATLFSMLTAAKVREAETANELLVMAVTEAVRPIRERAPWIAPQLAHVVDKALAFDKAHRWQSAAEMANALRALPSDALADPGVAATLLSPPNRPLVQQTQHVPTPTPIPPNPAAQRGSMPAIPLNAGAGGGAAGGGGAQAFTMMTSANTNPSLASGAAHPLKGSLPIIIVAGALAFLAIIITIVVVAVNRSPKTDAPPTTAAAGATTTAAATTTSGEQSPPSTAVTAPASSPATTPTSPATTTAAATSTTKKTKPPASAKASSGLPTPPGPAPTGGKTSDPFDRRL
jgi:eukaryotic-like serine/threonine-protein kinase